ncbi:hypothetical protein K469DRAFT_681396 [Zopfia rhizophila CBS 207.26]|uniref:Uncharacterized protein n=1 Tax=Zopfia rhizophila CBS 207.26 TaxID=1314779 RepID=A0A6A6ESA9_9PEZI|nr:hypothetical protein K469DRAFT_681396 [Zopfia rhizophila CBS 207.26]
MEDLMRQGYSPGTDFFEDTSSDDVPDGNENDREGNAATDQSSGREEKSGYITALPPFNQILAHKCLPRTAEPSETGDEEDPVQEAKMAATARHVSLKRMGRGRIVRHSSNATPRQSFRINNGSASNGTPALDLTQIQSSSSRPRTATDLGYERGKSDTESSLRANSIINAHAITMQALLSSDPDPPHLHRESQVPALSLSSPSKHRGLSEEDIYG